MGDQCPEISIALPVYNGGKFLRYAYESIRMQSLTNWELLVIDDGSRDGSSDFIQSETDPRVRFFRDGGNRGLAARLNEAVTYARGKYFARMDQDDIAFPDRLRFQHQFLEAHPEIDVVATRAQLIDENDNICGMFPFAGEHKEIVRRPWQGFRFPHPTWLGRLTWFKKHPYADPAPYFCEDQELLTRAYADSSLATVDECLFAYRIRSKPQPEKLRRTRIALWRAQLKVFASRAEWTNCLLCTGMLGTRLGVDALRRMVGGKGEASVSATISDTQQLRWRALLAELHRHIEPDGGS